MKLPSLLAIYCIPSSWQRLSRGDLSQNPSLVLLKSLCALLFLFLPLVHLLFSSLCFLHFSHFFFPSLPFLPFWFLLTNWSPCFNSIFFFFNLLPVSLFVVSYLNTQHQQFLYLPIILQVIFLSSLLCK